MAERLKKAGIEYAAGFCVNISNMNTDQACVNYGTEISRLVGGKHFVIDRGRNGNGPAPDAEWCNPSGRALGKLPTTETSIPLVDAFLWVRGPSGSDGDKNGAPPVGKFFLQHALELAKNAHW